MSGNEWATIDTISPEKDLHIGGTIKRGNSTEFWLTRPRPEGISLDEWERLEREKWQRIFGRKEK